MGIIVRQSVRGAFWSYFGIAVGYINVGIIMPQFLDTAQIGLIQIFLALSLIFSQFGTLGFTSVINRTFPKFRDPDHHNRGFLFLALAAGFMGFALSVAGFFLLKPWIIETNLEKSPLLVDYLYLLLPLVLMRLLFTLLDNYNKVLFDAVTGTFWMEFMHKVINLVLIIIFALGWLSFRQFFFGYIISLSIPVVPLIIVLIRRGEFSLKPQPGFLDIPLRRELGEVMTFGFVNGLAGILLVNVDKVFVNQYLSLEEVGIFGVCALFATLIKVPFNALSKISVGIIAEAWKRNDRAHIQEIYQKSALGQAIVGTLIFVGIMVNLHNIFRILPPEYSSGKQVLVIYSAGMLLVTIIGMASVITETSRYFRVTTYALSFSVVVQFVLSYLLIPRYGITGAAVATVTSILLNFVLQALLQKIAFGIVGLNRKLLLVFLAGIISYFSGMLIPHLSLVMDIVLRSGLVALLYVLIIILLKILPEFNVYFTGTMNRMKEVTGKFRK